MRISFALLQQQIEICQESGLLCCDLPIKMVFYFAILSPKNVYKQFKSNQKVEVCFYDNNSDWVNAKQMRVTGVVEFLDVQNY